MRMEDERGSGKEVKEDKRRLVERVSAAAAASNSNGQSAIFGDRNTRTLVYQLSRQYPLESPLFRPRKSPHDSSRTRWIRK